jgi:hypothetical protein
MNKEKTMKKNKFWIPVIALAFLLGSCSMAKSPLADIASGEVERLTMESAPAAAPMMEKGYAEEAASYDSASTGNAAERIVVKNASLSIVVTDPIASMKTISQMAESTGGFVVSSNTYKTTTDQGVEVPVANITIRVPVEKLDVTMEKIKDLVKDPELDVLNEEISGQDVTSEVTDLESRLRNLQAAETQLLEIMDKAETNEDVIAIFKELTSIREQIEVTQGQIKYYRESASLSAISVYLQAEEALEPITIGGWQPGLQVQKALQALVEGGKYIINGLIWLILFALPILAIIFLPIYLVVKLINKKKQAKPSAESKKAEKKS